MYKSSELQTRGEACARSASRDIVLHCSLCGDRAIVLHEPWSAAVYASAAVLISILNCRWYPASQGPTRGLTNARVAERPKRVGKLAGRKPKENQQIPREPTETQGPCPDLRGTCIKSQSVDLPGCVLGVRLGAPPMCSCHITQNSALRLQHRSCWLRRGDLDQRAA